MSIEIIADIIGDNVEQVTKTYAHILKRFKDNELDKLHIYYKNNNIIFKIKIVKQLVQANFCYFLF